MRFTTMLGLLAAWSALTLAARAAEKEVTLKGKIMCAKCELKEANKCQTAIKVKERGKEVTYYFADKGNKEQYHENVCGGGQKEGTVIGTVSEKDGKKWIKPSKVEYADANLGGAMERPHWYGEYALAQAEGLKQKKPLAVFIAAGASGWDKFTRDGKPGSEVEHLLMDQYVCVYLDTDTRAGKRLASAFEMSGGMGLILSDHTTQIQAFRHEGNLSRRELARYLKQYADPEAPAASSETYGADNAEQAAPRSPGPAFAPSSGSCPHCQRR